MSKGIISDHTLAHKILKFNFYSGPPDNDCRDEISYYIQRNSDKFAIILIFIGFLGLTSFGFSFAICYLKPKRLMGKQFKDFWLTNFNYLICI